MYIPFRTLGHILKETFEKSSDNRKISRRDLLVGGLELGVLGAGAVIVHGLLRSPEQTLANKLLKEFPSEIPGAYEVKKQAVVGAKYCLVHIKQMHDAKNMTPEMKQDINRVQDDIYKILSYLIDNCGLSEVYDEGLTLGFEALVEGMSNLERIGEKTHTKHEDLIREKIESLEIESNRTVNYEFKTPEEFNAYKHDLREQIKKLKEIDLPKAVEYDGQQALEKVNKKLNKSAVGRLIDEERITVKSSETMIANALASEVVEEKRMGKNVSDELYQQAIFDLREQIVLKIIDINKDSLAVVVYGGAHRFGNDINGWNKENPDKKFSLIEIWPAAYKELRTKK